MLDMLAMHILAVHLERYYRYAMSGFSEIHF